MPGTRLPAWLKRPLVAAWNGGHRVSRAAGEYLGAVRHRRFGRCEVCGKFGPWLYRRRVISKRLEELWGLSPRLAEALARKESSDCSFCGAKLRARRLARALLETFPVGETRKQATSVANWVRFADSRRLDIAEVNLIEGLHESLSRLPNLAFSDYNRHPENDLGRKRIPSEDLSRLSYPDARFDLVLTSETLEHVPDLTGALREVWRVLRPGGVHLFTIPLMPGVPKTFARTVVREDGMLEHRAPEIRHPGGDVGYPVFHEFGADLLSIFEDAGFMSEMLYGPVAEDDLGQVFRCRKRS